eukprot:scaffold867_cov229-Pinguiococcus_pyrenoidosus.AAC.4
MRNEGEQANPTLNHLATGTVQSGQTRRPRYLSTAVKVPIESRGCTSCARDGRSFRHIARIPNPCRLIPYSAVLWPPNAARTTQGLRSFVCAPPPSALARVAIAAKPPLALRLVHSSAVRGAAGRARAGSPPGSRALARARI